MLFEFPQLLPKTSHVLFSYNFSHGKSDTNLTNARYTPLLGSKRTAVAGLAIWQLW